MLDDRRHVIAAAVVAYIAWAFITDWIPSLRWIPHALIAGALATVAGLLYVIGTISRGVRGHEPAYADYGAVQPAFSATSTEEWKEATAALKAREEYRRPTIFPEARAFSRAVDGLLDVILRDYVTSWYGAISIRQVFQHEIDRCIRSVLLTVAARFTDLDVVEIGVSKLLPMITAHLKDFYDAEHAVRGKDLRTNEDPEAPVTATGKKRFNYQVEPRKLKKGSLAIPDRGSFKKHQVVANASASAASANGGAGAPGLGGLLRPVARKFRGTTGGAFDRPSNKTRCAGKGA